MRISDWSSDVCSSDLFIKDYKAKRKIAIVPEEGDAIEYLIPKSKVLEVQEGDQVKRGDALISGSPNPHDILDVMGVEALAEYLVAEIQEVYRLQGVKDRESVVKGKSVSVRVERGGRRSIKKTNRKQQNN